jgi:hypothetical protein
MKYLRTAVTHPSTLLADGWDTTNLNQQAFSDLSISRKTQ